MKLIREEIQFIDTYLANSGIEFLDIRSEMIDHIASGVERKMEMENFDFYDAFKSFMSLHKKEFLKTNRRYLTLAGSKALRILFRKIIHPLFGGLFLTIFLFFFLLTKLFSEFFYEVAFEVIQFGFIIVLAGTYIYQNFSKKEKYSVANKILGLYCLFSYFSNMVFRIQDKIQTQNSLFAYYAIMIAFSIIVYLTYNDLIKSYKNKYKVV